MGARRSRRLLAAVVVAPLLLGGCAATRQTNLQAAVRKSARFPVSDAQGMVPAIFRDLAGAAGIDARTVYVAVEKRDALNATALGKHYFLVTRGALALGDPCLVTGIAAHELAHDLLQHPETIAKTSDVTTVLATMLATAVGVFVPGGGYLVQGATSLGLRAYSRAQESEADRLAVTLLRRAGKPDWSLRYALELLQRQPGAAGSGGWLSTHPALAERIAAQPPVDVAEARRLCGAAPPDPPAWCRGERDHYDRATGSCTTGAGGPPAD